MMYSGVEHRSTKMTDIFLKLPQFRPRAKIVLQVTPLEEFKLLSRNAFSAQAGAAESRKVVPRVRHSTSSN